MSREPQGRTFYFIGERLCIDFVNTEIVEGGHRVDLLRGFDDLVQWCAASDVINTDEAPKFARLWRGTRDGDAAFQFARGFRATLREMLEQFAIGRTKVPQQTLDGINGVFRLGGSTREVVRTKRGYEARLRRSITFPTQLLVPVAESAADLLVGDDLALVKKCQNPQCILFFFDTTKNHGRRWCSMSACGNRAKVAAHYRRAREDASS